MGYGSGVETGLVVNDRYLLEDLLNDADGVTTWRAIDQILSRPVIVHVLDPADPRSGWVLAAARKAATITDSHFIRVLDALEGYGMEPWTFVVSEFSSGRCLAEILEDGPVTNEQAVLIASELARALAPLHAIGVFHRRIDPTHVFITTNGHVKIAGLLVDQALRPRPGEEAMTMAQQETGDLDNLGRLLFALTTGRAPTVGESEPRRTNPGVEPRLSALISRILAPGDIGGGVGTVDRLQEALDFLALPDASENLLESLAHPPADPTTVVNPLDDASLPTTVVTTTSSWPSSHPYPTRPAAPSPPAVPDGFAHPRVPGDEAGPAGMIARPGRTGIAPRPTRSGRVPVKPIGVLFALLVLVIALVRGCHPQHGEPGLGESSETQAGEVRIVTCFDFDPRADGGENDENTSQAMLAIDGDPSTSWNTLTYYGSSAFGGLKPGAGLVFDLGTPGEVHNVTLMLANQPNGIELRIPAEEDQRSAEQAPQQSVSQWEVVASKPLAGQEVVLAPESAVTTRWVLVYFTNLPPIADGQYRSGIAEAYINR